MQHPHTDKPIQIDQHHPTPGCCHAAKWEALFEDRPLPLPRRRLLARDILDQAGSVPDMALVRDNNNPNDIIFADGDEVDLAEGNVFRAIPKCEVAQCPRCDAPPKLAFFLSDAWEVTTNPNQTGHTLKRLFGLPDTVELLRDYESPDDEPIGNEQPAVFRDGPVFRTRGLVITVKVNNQPVRFDHRRVTALEVKQTAMAQDVAIDAGCVLFPVKPGGGLGAAIPDEQTIVLKECDEFRCVAPDDNS